jgi:proteasome lid subunit RPN8/RPN11
MLHVPDSILEQTIHDLRSLLPEEGVGLWSGRGQEVLHWLPLSNASDRPDRSYRVDPQEWLDALAKVQTLGLVPIALVHSHPTDGAFPSARDIREWFYPELLCVIISYQSEPPIWRAYTINHSQNDNRTAP